MTQIMTQSQTQKAPIITSLLDTDHYKWTMGQFAFHRHPDVPVVYTFKNRTKGVRLADIVDEGDLRAELDNIRQLRVSDAEIQYLASLRNNGGRLFQPDFVESLPKLVLPDYKLKKVDGDFILEFPGEWKSAIYWETPALAVMNELYYREIMKSMTPEQRRAVFQEGQRRLEEKIQILEQNPDIRFLEFGTRRRFSKEWQDYVVRTLKERVTKQMTGTSNVALAMKYGLDPKGTMAHETFMVYSGIMHKNDDDIRASHNQVLVDWWDEYGFDLSVALPDTYGSHFFFKDFTTEQARKWKGMRPDSGVPEEFGERQIAFYEGKGIDPREKVCLPSDGLDIYGITRFQNQFRGRIIPGYGWGTNLTNDLGLGSLSLVIKATKSNGHGTVKLSDNPNKAMGAPEDVARFKRIVEYDNKAYQRQECKY